jgi:hypothetical protein
MLWPYVLRAGSSSSTGCWTCTQLQQQGHGCSSKCENKHTPLSFEQQLSREKV